jgi:MFS family permease
MPHRLSIFTGIGSLILGISLIQLANGYVGTLIGIRLGLEHVEPTVAGLVTSAYFAGYAMSALLCHRLIERTGHIRAFAAFAALVAAAFLVHAIYFDPIVWTVLRMIAGFGCAGLYVATESWLNVKATPETRGKVFAIYMVATYTTFAGGQFALTLASPTSFTLFALAAILFCVALVLVSTTRAEQPVPIANIRLKAGELALAAPVAVAGCFTAGLINGAFFGLVPVYAELNGLSVPEIATYMALAITGGLLLQIPIGRLSDQFDRRLVAGFAALIFAALALLIVPTRHNPIFPIIWFLLGGFMGVIYPVNIAHANDRMPSERAVSVSGRMILIFGIGSACGPLLGSGMMSYLGIQGLFYFMAAVTSLLAVYALIRGFSIRPPTSKRRRAFLLQPTVAQDQAHAPDQVR